MGAKERKEAALRRQQELLNVAKTENRDLTKEEILEFEQLQREIEICDQELEQGAATQRAVEEERKRVKEITDLCRSFQIEPDSFIQNGKTIEETRAAVLEKLKTEHPPISTKGIDGMSVLADEEEKFRSAVSDALLMRGGLSVKRPADGFRDFMGMSLRDIAIDALERMGEKGINRKSSDELYSLLCRAYFNPSNAFTAIMDQSIQKAYIEGYRTVPVTFDKWTKKGSLNDFKIHDNYYLAGPAGLFYEVPEGGELKHDVMRDEKRPTRQLKTYGRQFTMTRQTFINDDIGFLTKMPAKYAASARKTLNKQVYSILIDNPVIYDGAAVFGKHHKNVLASGSGITKEAVQTMFLALQQQKDEFGEAIVIRPAVIIVPIGYMFEMYTLFYSPTIQTNENTQATNPLYNYRESIQVIEEPTLNVLCAGKEVPWFLVGDSSDTDFIEVDYLNGNEMPQIRRMEASGQLGFVWDIYLDWGVTVMDWHGCVKNPGVKVKHPLE